MKTKVLCLLLFCFSVQAWAQRSPQHPMDIPQGSTDIYTILDAWEPGAPPPGTNKFDDQFYISRVKPLKRIEANKDYQVNPSLDRDRKLCLWVPLDDPSTQWKALPRYCFEGDNFSMWSYTDIHGNWTAPWMRVTAGITDVAHKNGVKVGCVMSVPWNITVYASQYGNEYGKTFYRMFQKNADGTTYKYSDKLVKLMKYYGIDGLGCNSEFRTNRDFMNDLIAFVKDCKQKAKAIEWEFQLHWYDGTNDNGGISFDMGLGVHNDGIFGDGAAPVTDMLFANYNWSNSDLANSVTKATELGRSSYDYYAGFDIQGRAFKNSNWQALKNNKISIGLWGAHAQSLLHQSATDDGSSDIAIQKAYLEKQELTFSGGNRNPGLNPAIRADATLANADLKTFHGLSALLTAKSTLQQIPFVTRFSLGNGLFFNNEGKTTFNHKWYNLSTQDFLPTWRWWITDQADQVTETNLAGLIKADFTFDDAWFGGSCLKLHGQTNFSRVKLFKTKFTGQPDYTVSLTYKVLNGVAPKAKLFIAKQNALTDYKEITLPAAEKQGEWFTYTANLSELGIAAGDVISMMGISLENTPADYAMLLGEMAVRNPAQTFGTVTPVVTKFDVLRRRYNELDFKVFYQSKDETNGVKTYNDEVGTWYYEIYLQQKDQPQQLLTATTSWAGYVIDAPIVTTGANEARVGVRAVSPDGKQGSPIAWTDYQPIPYNTPIDEPVIDKPVVKPNETFTVKYKDELHEPAQKWEIKDPLTGNSLASAINATQVTTQIPQVGLYDLYITDAKGNTVITRGFVQITPEETGALPTILTFGADKQKAAIDEVVRYAYTSKDGEGTVSRALRIEDPNMFMVPADAQKGYDYSYAVWFKVNKYSHDKQGTNLINKNSIADKWPHNNWGDLWVTIRPEWKGATTTHPANEISFNTLGWTGHDSPNEKMMSSEFSVTPGVWNHLVVTQNAAKTQKMYFNGKKVAETVFSTSARREDYGDSRINAAQPANIFFGGGGVYKAGFDGWIDEVQVWNKALTDEEVLQAMKGYTAAPAELTAYYTFEEVKDGTYFENKGSGGNFQGKVVKIDGSGGESTGTAAYVSVAIDNNQLGYPGITGSLTISTTPEWLLTGAELPAETNAKQIDVVYKSIGTHDAALTLANRWGAATKNLVQYIEITAGSGISKTNSAELNVYPNPFVESVNMKFIETGKYTARIYNQNGQLVHQAELQVNAPSEIVNLKINGEKGNYLLQILKGNQVYSTLKLIKN